MRFLLRLFSFLVLGAALYFLFRIAQASQVGDNPDNGKLVVCYAGIVLVGAGLATLVAVWFLPLIGDFVGGFFYSPEVEERHPHASALAKVAAGDYLSAIGEYEARIEASPEDILAVHEVVHLYCDKLHEPQNAADFLQRMLEMGDWNDYQRALLFERLQEIRATLPSVTHHDPHYAPHHDEGTIDGGL